MAKVKQKFCWCGGVVEESQRMCGICQTTSENLEKFEPLAAFCQNSSSVEPWAQATMCCVCRIKEKCQKRLAYVVKKQSENERKGGQNDLSKKLRMASVCLRSNVSR